MLNAGSGSELEMHCRMDKFSSACNAFGLTISTKKTEVTYEPAPQEEYSEPSITVNGETLKAMDKFTYLGSTLARNVHINNDVYQRIAKVSAAFGKLGEKVWERKVLVSRQSLRSTRPLACPHYYTPVRLLYSHHAKVQNRFHLNCLRRIMKITWSDKIPDTDALQLAEMTSLYTMIRKKTRIQWAGHVVRMDDGRPPKRLSYGELATGKRFMGGHFKHYKDSLKVSLKNFGIDPDKWESVAMERATWRSAINTALLVQEQQVGESSGEESKPTIIDGKWHHQCEPNKLGICVPHLP